MPLQSVTRSFVRTVTVADGVFAPGHLGELTQWVPFELVDDLLVSAKAMQRRVRVLPSRVGMYFVLALALFAQDSYLDVWGHLVAGLRRLPGLRVASPTDEALGQVRRRIGPGPVKALFETLAVPLGRPGVPGVYYRRWRTVAFDGCSSLRAAEVTRGWLGRARHWLGLPSYPTLMLVTLVATGTRGMLAAVFGPAVGPDTGEISYARRLCHHLHEGLLLLGDRAYDNTAFLHQVARTRAMFLVRVKCTRVLPVLAVLPDKSFLSRLDGLTVRVIEAEITARDAAGDMVAADRYRLITTLLDHRSDPAPILVGLYHERWEIETAYYALRHTILNGRVLRSRTPALLEQEVWAILTVYQLLRTAMVEATDAVPGTNPDRASFTTALNTARDQVITATGVLPDTDPTGRIVLTTTIAQAIQNHLLPPRRPRISARKVKSPTSRYPARPATDPRPLTSTDITDLTITIEQPAPPQITTTDPHPDQGTTPDRPRGLTPILTAMATSPDRPWHAREIAAHLGETNINSTASRLSRWAAQGKLHKIGRATYRLRPLNPSTVT